MRYQHQQLHLNSGPLNDRHKQRIGFLLHGSVPDLSTDRVANADDSMADGCAEVAKEYGLAGVFGLWELALKMREAAEVGQRLQRLLATLQCLLIHCCHLHHAFRPHHITSHYTLIATLHCSIPKRL